MELANTVCGLRNPELYAPLWVVDFPLLELDEENWVFTTPCTIPFYMLRKPADNIKLLDFGSRSCLKANPMICVLNGKLKLGGGSYSDMIKAMQATMFKAFRIFPWRKAKAPFGFLDGCFSNMGPPPHGRFFSLLVWTRWLLILGGQETIRDLLGFFLKK